MKKIALVLITVLAVAFACSKDQRTVNRLDGRWKVTGIKENGVAEPDSAFAESYINFEKCRVKSSSCNGSFVEGGKSFPFTYSITDKGTKLNITFLGQTSTSEIIENSRKRFVYKTTDGSDVTETTIEKV